MPIPIGLKARPVSRRAFVIGLSAATALSTLPVSLAAAIRPPIKLFLRASALITGIPLDNSYIQLGEQVWRAVTAGAKSQELEQWVALANDVGKMASETSDGDLHAVLKSGDGNQLLLARKLAGVWYTGYKGGAVDTENGTVLTYDDALVWRACAWTKPPATCGGPFGYWQLGPQGQVPPQVGGLGNSGDGIAGKSTGGAKP